jgi:cytosine/adenosine deaminase-related metal-dependent hydrolase
MILLENIQFIDWKTFEITEGNLLIETGIDQAIRFVTNEQAKSLPLECKRQNCKGKFATKSFVNAHHHAYSALATGMPPPVTAPENFLEILERVWWKLDKALSKDAVEISAALTAVSSAKNGVSFVIDHHASPNCVSGSLKNIAAQFEKTGLNHLLCYEISDRDGLAVRDAGLAETEDYLQNNQGLVGLHAAFTLSDESLKQAQILAEKYQSGVHIHVAEDFHEQQYSLEIYGKPVVYRLADFGLTNFEKTILAHCIHIDDFERNLIANSNSWVVQNPESNLNNRVGFFNSHKLKSKTLLGTDGMHSNMIRSAQWAYFAGLAKDNIDLEKIYSRLRTAHTYLDSNNFRGDGENNIVVFDYDGATPLTQNNFLGHFFYAFENRHIQSLIVNGEFVMKDRLILNQDEAFIHKESKKLAKILWKKMS